MSETLSEAFALVVLVVFLFMGNLRATIIPAVAVPVSLIGTFIVLLAMGYSANTVSLLALVLAIGIVVDDAIVVVENVERVIEEEPELTPAEAAKAMRQITAPVIAITLVLLSVFVQFAIIDGGGHERGMRSGTLNVPGIVGLGKACAIAQEEMPQEACRLAGLRNRLRDRIMNRLDEAYINGSTEHRLPGNLNISFAYVEGESLLMGINDIAVSSGSACTSATLEPSYVLKALGTGDDLAHSSIRFGIGRFNTEPEVDYVADRVIETVERLRELSPLYEILLSFFPSAIRKMEHQLYDAAENGREEEVRKLLRENPNLKVNWANPDCYNCTALIWACSNGHDKVVTLLLAHPDIDVNQKDDFGGTPFCLACLQWKDQLCSIAAQGCQGQGQ